MNSNIIGEWIILRVLFVTKGYHFPRGGAENAAKQWFNRLRNHVDILLATDTNPAKPNPWLLSSANPLAFTHYICRMTRKVEQICSWYHPDLIHVHSYSGFIIIPPNITTIVTLHDEPFYHLVDGISGFPSGHLYGIIKQFEYFMRHRLLSQNPYVQALSSTIANQIKRYYPSIKSKIIPNPIAIGARKRSILSKKLLLKRLGLPNGAKIVFSVGNLTYRKGIHKLLETAFVLKDQNVHFIVAGQAPNVLFKYYERKIRHHISNLNLENLHLVGFVSDDLLHNLYYHADAYISPALSEACSLSLIAAASYKKPIIATDVGAARDMFENKAILLPRCATGLDLAEGVRRALANPKTNYNNLKAYSWKRMIALLIDFYTEVTGLQ